MNLFMIRAGAGRPRRFLIISSCVLMGWLVAGPITRLSERRRRRFPARGGGLGRSGGRGGEAAPVLAGWSFTDRAAPASRPLVGCRGTPWLGGRVSRQMRRGGGHGCPSSSPLALTFSSVLFLCKKHENLLSKQRNSSGCHLCGW